MEVLLKNPAPSVVSRILPPRVRIDGCLFFTGEQVQADSVSFLEILTGMHESAERELARGYLVADVPLIDLGAGLGTVSIAAAAALGIPYVIACEPNTDLVPVLRRNMAVNRVDGVTVPMGIWYGDQKPYLVDTDNRWTGISLQSGAQSGQRGRPVPAITLSELLEEHLDSDEPFQLVCDIEGLEWQLFRVESELLASRCVCLVVELHADPSASGTASRRSIDELLADADDALSGTGLERVANISAVAAYTRKL
jgi:FkbM family methyltransferase